MHPFADCPNWEYKDYPKHSTLLATRAALVLKKIHRGELLIASAIGDTRPLHAALFQGLVPAQQSYLAGHYRGEDFRCLKFRSVGIAINPLVGTPPEVVHLKLAEFFASARALIATLDETFKLPDMHMPPAEKLKCLVAAACRLFADFLIIHPYANGNGHIGRIMLIWALARYDYWMINFPIEPRPPHPGYDAGVFRYQHGDIEPLEELIFTSLIA